MLCCEVFSFIALYNPQGSRELARQAGVEPTTPWFVARYSIQLSYWRAACLTTKTELYINFFFLQAVYF